MKINWGALAMKLPVIISTMVGVVNHIKGAKGSEKKQAVLDAIPSSLELIEFAAGKNILNDPAILQLVGAAIDAEAAALKARDALRLGLLTRETAPNPTS